MSAQAQMRALLDQLMGTARDGSVYLCQPTSICKGVAEKPHVHRAVKKANWSAGLEHKM
uniref:LUC7-like (S. cerevisiae) n=1 Tax=Amphilophus citrinellus TaxID=61819 RepID=A0A3Q0QQI1_AMPCI